MALKAGSVDQLAGSLGELIDRAFAAELYAKKGKEMPEAGQDERRVLFTAIAQGVLAYLAENEDDIEVRTNDASVDAWLRIRAPRVVLNTSSSTQVGVTLQRFPAHTDVVVAWEGPHANPTTVHTDSLGGATTGLPRAGRSGPQGVSARDANGNTAVGAVVL